MTFTIPNLPASPTALQTRQSEMYASDLAILAQADAGSGIITGCGVTTNSLMTLTVAAGTALSLNSPVTVAGGTATITTADATNPRIDLVVATSAGAVAVRAGTAAASPVPPSLSAGDIALAAIDVAAGVTTITAAMIVGKGVPIAGTNIDDAIFYPRQGISAGAFTQGASTTYYQYLGRAKKAFTSAVVRLNVVVAGVTLSYAEVGIYRGTIATLGTMPLLTKIATANATLTAIAKVNTTVALSGVNAGDDLWVAVGVGTQGTAVQYLASAADGLQSGIVASDAARPSTTVSTTPTVSGIGIPAMVVRLS